MVKKEKFRTEIFDTANERDQLHQEVVLIFVLEGKLDVTVENKISHLREEDLLVINANKKHNLHSPGDVLYMALFIDYSLITNTLKRGDVIFWCDSSVAENGRYEDLRTLVRRMLNRYVESGNESEGFGYLSDCYAILNNLTANFLIKMYHEADAGDNERYEERIEKINDYIYANYDQPISMKELSEKLYLSNGYLYRFFKKNYGMSFASYLSSVRVRHAADELLYTNAPITRIAYNSGFTSAALFNKVFKKSYGVTPSEFRKRAMAADQQKDDEAHKKNIQKRLEKLLVNDSTADKDLTQAQVVNGEFHADQYEMLKPFWSEVVNFGNASNLMRSSVREQLMLLHQALGFKYVRFSNIFSKKLYIDPTKDSDYNFSQIDSLLDFILEQGMKPFIELGLKPYVIHYGVGETKNAEPDVLAMNQIPLNKWTNLVQAFLRHLENRYGINALDDWKMELWYDEDWRRDPDRNNSRYLSYFNATWQLIKQFNKNIEFGGYSVRMDVGEDRRRRFYELWSQDRCRPDFISIMYYGYERQENGLDQYARRNPDMNALSVSVAKEKKILAECGLGDVPVIIDDWNLTPSVRNYINDTPFKAAYIVKNNIDLYGMVDAMAYGAGSDSIYSSYDTPEILFGGTGLMTNDGIMKPAAFAYEFLNHRMMPQYLGKTSNYMVTADGHDSYAIICHNMQNLNYNYYLTNESEMDRTSMWKYYEGRTKLNVRIRIDGVEEGKYKIKIYRINENHGNVLKIWGNLNYEKDPNREDIKYFRRKCEPDLKIQPTETIDGALIIEEQLKPNEIMMIRVHKIRE